MRTIAESNVLLRVHTELPAGLKLATTEFREGWNFVRSADVRRLGKKIQKRGWNFIKISDGSLRSGVGDTSQEAIASALKLALRRVSAPLNAVEVEHIQLTQYPWFFLARVRVYPYRIQQRTVMSVGDQPSPIPAALAPRPLPPHAAELIQQFGSTIPMLKEMLILSQSSQTRAE